MVTVDTEGLGIHNESTNLKEVTTMAYTYLIYPQDTLQTQEPGDCKNLKQGTKFPFHTQLGKSERIDKRPLNLHNYASITFLYPHHIDMELWSCNGLGLGGGWVVYQREDGKTGAATIESVSMYECMVR
jgi:hypothetical protein